MNVLIRVDGNPTIGSGHVVRTLNLSRILVRQGHNVHFALRTSDRATEEFIRQSGHQTHRLSTDLERFVIIPNDYRSWLGGDEPADAMETAALASQVKAAVVIVDHYGASAIWDEIVGGVGSILVVLDDFIDKERACDVLVIPSSIDARAGASNTNFSRVKLPLIGPKFAPLNDAFGTFRTAIHAERTSISVYLGSSPPGDIFDAIVEDVVAGAEDRTVEIAGTPESSRLRQTSVLPKNVQLIDRQDSLAPLFSRSLVSVGAAGSTTWERCCLGVPSLVVSVSENQVHIAEDISLLGAHVNLGYVTALKPGIVADALSTLLSDPTRMAEMGKIGKDLVDGLGATRIVEAILHLTR
jgi:UDP-2,4-diacetamido-2,4,6-trideoxy-beta-L-altropyranose hydrolase